MAPSEDQGHAHAATYDTAQAAQNLTKPTSASQPWSQQDLLQARRNNYGPNAALSYDEPLHIVRGKGTRLYDDTGAEYLDCVNNVAHVGHCHPVVTAALCEQLATLNTNSRYLHHKLVEYTQQLTATMPAPLKTLYMVCSGSEANELALRIARAACPGACHVAVMGGAYHGHTSALISMSPYKFWGTGGAGKEPHIHVVPCPDPYRGEHLDGRAAARAVIAEAQRAGGRICAFFAESILSCGGQIFMPPGYLQAVYEEMHAHGAVCVADEVQCGFGRVGRAFWAFETQGVVPDIVTIGKPMGNGYPVAGVVTNRELAQRFSTGMEYFNTYGGGTAQCAAALAVMGVIKEERLQQRAQEVGDYLLSKLRALQPLHPCLGDVRGMGLFTGIDVVSDPITKQHAPRVAKWIKERVKARRVLLSTDGPYDNVLKMKPPMVFGTAEVDQLVDALRDVLQTELTPAVWDELMVQELYFRATTIGPRMARYQENARALGLAAPAAPAAAQAAGPAASAASAPKAVSSVDAGPCDAAAAASAACCGSSSGSNAAQKNNASSCGAAAGAGGSNGAKRSCYADDDTEQLSSPTCSLYMVADYLEGGCTAPQPKPATLAAAVTQQQQAGKTGSAAAGAGAAVAAQLCCSVQSHL